MVGSAGVRGDRFLNNDPQHLLLWLPSDRPNGGYAGFLQSFTFFVWGGRLGGLLLLSPKKLPSDRSGGVLFVILCADFACLTHLLEKKRWVEEIRWDKIHGF